MHVVKSVGVMSVAKIMGATYGCLALIFAPFIVILGLAGSFAGHDKLPFAGIFGIVFALILPLIYGVMGFVLGAIGAFLYNLIAKWMGGFELELEVLPSGTVAPYPIVPPATPSV